MNVSVLLPRCGKATVVGWGLPTPLASRSLVPKGQLWCLISCPWIAKRTICLQYETPDHFPTGLSWGWQLQLQAWERITVGLLGCQGWGQRAGPSELPAKAPGKPLSGKGHREEADKGLVVPRAEPQAGNPFVGLAALSDSFLPPPQAASWKEGGRARSGSGRESGGCPGDQVARGFFTVTLDGSGSRVLGHHLVCRY